MSETFNYLGESARLSDTDDGLVLAVNVNDKRIPASAWTLAQKVFAAGRDGVVSGDVSETDASILRGAKVRLRTDPSGFRVWLDERPVASKFVLRVPQEKPKRAKQHYSGGAPLAYEGPRYGR